jgi:ferredoxin
MILYFSATGNSEYIAKKLAHLTSDEAVSINDYMKKGEQLNLTSEKPYVLIAPVYISTIPGRVAEFIKNGSLEGNKDFYVIMTCAGSGVSASGAEAVKICEKLNLNYRGIAHLTMPQDYLMFFEVKGKEENEVIMNEAIDKVPAIAEKINNNEDLDTSKVGAAHTMSVAPVTWLFDTFFIKPKKFYSTEECISCGICAKVCPLNNIKIIDGKPVWGKDCIHCSACINRCPKLAIEYGKKTIGKNRYVAKKYIKGN